MKKFIIIGTALAAIIAVTLICVFSGKDSEPEAIAVSSSEIRVTDGNVTRGDFLSMCMYLYEQLSGKAVMPKETNGSNPSQNVRKAYAIGVIGENDPAVYSGDSDLTREEAASLLYTTMLCYKLSVKLSMDEINTILNECYDNMSLDYKDACAFVINSGAVRKAANFYPEKMLTSAEAADWINSVYKLYSTSHTVTFKGGEEVRCGYTAGELVKIMGQPQRIDKSFYEGENYIYNKQDIYAIFYINKGVVRGFFSNLGVKSTSDSFEELDGAVCAYYRAENERVKHSTAALREIEQMEFLEMLNAYRQRNGMGALVERKSLLVLAEENSRSVSESGIDLAIPEKVAVVQGISNEDMYIKLVTSKKYEGVLSGGRRNEYAAAGLWYGSIEPCITILIDKENKVEEQETVPEKTPHATPQPVYSGEVPHLASPLAEDTAGDGTPIVIRLAQRTTESFIARVSNAETGENVVYARVYGDSLVVSPDVLENGFDYVVTVSVDDGGEEKFSELAVVRYGTPEVPSIVSPMAREFVDTEKVSVSWKSRYSDFTLSVFTEAGEFLGAQRVSNSTETIIEGLTDGKYILELTAHRKDTNEIMSSVQSTLFVQLNTVDITRTEIPLLSFSNNKYSSVFGGSLVYSSKVQADANMQTVTVPVWKLNSDGQKYAAQMSVTVNKAIASQVVDIFTEIYNGPEKFPIKSLGGYNWRSTATGSRSQHSYGTCIDINPDENYCIYNSGTRIGKYWKPYEDPYSITPDGDVMRAFRSRGWTWGGEWNSLKDYMHFSYLGG